MLRATLTAASICMIPSVALAEPQRFELDPEQTMVAVLVSHLGFSNVLGQFTDVSGSFVFDEETETLSEVDVRVGTESFRTNSDRRDNHIRSKDFLDVENFPEMNFAASEGEVTGDGSGTVIGELTLLGVTNPVTLDVSMNKREAYPFGHERYTLGISARGQINRSDWGMSYGIAEGWVGDEVELIIETQALREE